MSDETYFVTISNPKYRKEFIAALDDMAFFVKMPYLSISSSESVVRKPFWTWMKQKAINLYDSHQSGIFDALGLDIDTPAHALAWSCVLAIAYDFLQNSPSSSYNNQLTYWGKQIESFILRLGDYAVDEKIVSKIDWQYFSKKLLDSLEFCPQGQPSPYSAHSNGVPPCTDSDFEKYKDYSMPPLEDPPSIQDDSGSKNKTSSPFKRIFVTSSLMIGILFSVLFFYSSSLEPASPSIAPPPASSKPASSASRAASSSSKPASSASRAASSSSKPASSSSRAASSSSKPASSASRAASSSSSLQPVSKPKTGLFRRSSSLAGKDVAPLVIYTASTTDYYVLLCQNKKVVLGYFIRGGDTLDVDVPLGRYTLYYASAPSSAPWYGEKNLFGASTSLYTSDDVFDFYADDEAYNGYSLKLYKVSGGNMVAEDISQAEWNDLIWS